MNRIFGPQSLNTKISPSMLVLNILDLFSQRTFKMDPNMLLEHQATLKNMFSPVRPRFVSINVLYNLIGLPVIDQLDLIGWSSQYDVEGFVLSSHYSYGTNPFVDIALDVRKNLTYFNESEKNHVEVIIRA